MNGIRKLYKLIEEEFFENISLENKLDSMNRNFIN